MVTFNQLLWRGWSLRSFPPVVDTISFGRPCSRKLHMRFPNVARTLVLPLALIGCHRGAAPTAAAPESPACSLPAAAQPVSLAGNPAVDPLVTFDTAWTIIKRTHWDTTYNGVNWDALRTELRPKAAAATTVGQLRSVLSDMIARLNQSHFSIIPREASDVTPGASASGSGAREQSGTTGITLRLIDNELIVTAVADESPAARAGIQIFQRMMPIVRPFTTRRSHSRFATRGGRLPNFTVIPGSALRTSDTVRAALLPSRNVARTLSPTGPASACVPML